MNYEAYSKFRSIRDENIKLKKNYSFLLNLFFENENENKYRIKDMIHNNDDLFIIGKDEKLYYLHELSTLIQTARVLIDNEEIIEIINKSEDIVTKSTLLQYYNTLNKSEMKITKNNLFNNIINLMINKENKEYINMFTIPMLLYIIYSDDIFINIMKNERPDLLAELEIRLHSCVFDLVHRMKRKNKNILISHGFIFYWIVMALKKIINYKDKSKYTLFKTPDENNNDTNNKIYNKIRNDLFNNQNTNIDNNKCETDNLCDDDYKDEYKKISSVERELWKSMTWNELYQKSLVYARHSLYKFIAFHHANNENKFDVVQLAYYLSIVDHDNQYDDHSVIEEAIKIIFEKQNPDGTWKLSNPFLTTSTGGRMRCFSLEIPLLLFKSIHFIDYAECYYVKLELTLTWINDNIIRGKFFDINDNNKIKKTEIGWHSDGIWFMDPSEAWASALIVEYFIKQDIFINKLLNIFISTVYKAEQIVEDLRWDNLLFYPYINNKIDLSNISNMDDIKKIICGYIHNNKTYRFIKERIIDYYECHNELNHNGIILYGPPGSGKSTIAEFITSELFRIYKNNIKTTGKENDEHISDFENWKLITITPAVIHIDGRDKSINNAERIFTELFMDIKNIVILLDEFDSEFHNREESNDNILVSSMLPWLQKLIKKNKKIILIIATNYLDKIDHSIQRPGRFDLVLPVYPYGKFINKLFIYNKIVKDIEKYSINISLNIIEENINNIFSVIDEKFFKRLRDHNLEYLPQSEYQYYYNQKLFDEYDQINTKKKKNKLIIEEDITEWITVSSLDTLYKKIIYYYKHIKNSDYKIELIDYLDPEIIRIIDYYLVLSASIIRYRKQDYYFYEYLEKMIKIKKLKNKK